MNVRFQQGLRGFVAVVTLMTSAWSLAATPTQTNEYQQWLQQTQDNYQSYLDKNDRAFLTFLNQRWKDVEVEPAQQRDPEPKPDTLPVARPAPVDTPEPARPTSEPLPPPVVVAPLPPSTPRPAVIPPESLPANPNTVQLTFYGRSLSVEIPDGFKQTFSGRPDNKRIATYWQQLASSQHQSLVDALTAAASDWQLNDWATAVLFSQFAHALHDDPNSQVLNCWFLLVKAGFDARVAYDQQIHLLLPAQEKLYGVTYFELDQQRYYAIQPGEQPLGLGTVKTYQGTHELGSRPIGFSDPYRFVPGGGEETRTLSFRWQGQTESLQVSYPADYSAYLATYPQLALPGYFQAGLPAVTAQQLLDQLRPRLARLNDRQSKINYLLRLVQTGFRYETDAEQFQSENYLFPLETLHYPYSDCEDRAALFGWLAQQLLDADVLIVELPGHVATAIAMNATDSAITGSGWRFEGKRYLVADPTYINADLGMMMPRYQDQTPTLRKF
ncbi:MULTISPECIES: hypothetical protein [unclassified Oceanobacter]|jgi:hypothetical protein|uniref:hypothetical protein n=1 Tax=unclassified Oceanobacter TaxID=2620260 RepID=UPI0026E265A1|nr:MULTISPECIES: hypothetical protein [unclassified Oceanobacter]MDO6682043.1 hypothetical protein [Oceanobacter sp. 5_MG-2023]MDP2505562.1 hypothetical protein [Oceanobacter sp. 3_MG-2023]MDP2547144.1 hypothetical protein [Oceanobacter sp. 4_MG-2023]